MKKGIIVLCLASVGFVNAQSTSREIETYERWENGELVEERSSAKENGKPIENFDFDAWKQERQLSADSSNSSVDFESKKQEMDQRMKEMQAKSEVFFEKKKAEMEIKMNELKKRTDKMELDMQKRMKEHSQKVEQEKSQEAAPKKPSIQSKPTTLKTVRT